MLPPDDLPQDSLPPGSLPQDDLPPPPATPPFDLLGGVRVLDLTTSIAGPYATLLLADFGAEVVKLERPGGGDDSRHWGPPFLAGDSLWFLSVNRNKRSVALDSTSAAGRAVFEDLVRAADVVVTNQVPRVQAKLAMDPATLHALKPDLIVATVTGFGLTGARRDAPCYDLIAEGYSGVMDLTGEAEAPPQKIGTPAADLLAGHDLALSVAAALVRKGRTGQGAVVDVSMVESMTRFMTPRLASYLGSGDLPRRSGARDSVIAVYQVFDTADAPLTLGLGNDAIWRRFWGALGEPKRGEAAEHATNAGRRVDRAAIVADIQERLLARPRAEWLALFETHKVPAGPILRLDEIASDPALRERGFLYAMPRDGKPAAAQINTGVHIDGAPNSPRSAPPDLGADADAVLADWLGYDADRRRALRDNGALG
ncbi:MAG: CoA transferase [Alphaproteobacteria bacterium]|nr:CoA transferase [Alphaproteobacteria bacterium]